MTDGHAQWLTPDHPFETWRTRRVRGQGPSAFSKGGHGRPQRNERTTPQLPPTEAGCIGIQEPEHSEWLARGSRRALRLESSLPLLLASGILLSGCPTPVSPFLLLLWPHRGALSKPAWPIGFGWWFDGWPCVVTRPHTGVQRRRRVGTLACCLDLSGLGCRRTGFDLRGHTHTPPPAPTPPARLPTTRAQGKDRGCKLGRAWPGVAVGAWRRAWIFGVGACSHSPRKRLSASPQLPPTCECPRPPIHL